MNVSYLIWHEWCALADVEVATSLSNDMRHCLVSCLPGINSYSPQRLFYMETLHGPELYVYPSKKFLSGPPRHTAVHS